MLLDAGVNLPEKVDLKIWNFSGGGIIGWRMRINNMFCHIVNANITFYIILLQIA